ncbi:MAG TPA: hypothetical protein VH369_21370 [Bryobacteraceae bacterium]
MHAALLGGLAAIPAGTPPQSTHQLARRYNIRFLYMPLPKVRQQAAASGARSAGALQYRSSSAPSAASADSGTRSPVRRYRPFELPPNARVQPVKQTLVQPDLPPNLPLKQNLSIPAILLWTQTAPPPFPTRKFVAPQLKQLPKVRQTQLSAAPSLNTPNGEVAVADLRIANSIINDLPRLPRMPATTSPVRVPGPEIAPKIPQITVPDPSQSNVTNVISLPDIPLRSSGTIVLPPANQIAASGAAEAGAGSGHGASSTSAQGPGSGNSGTQSGTQGAAGAGSQQSGAGILASARAGAGGVAGTGGPGNGGPGIGVSAGMGNGSGTNGVGTGATNALGFDSSELTRLTLPKEGKYGVLILGSEAAAPYPESVGVLTGKLIYTVYLKVGLRKSWILQYCLPQDVPPKTHSTGTTRAPLDPPYPFFIMRPNTLDSQEPEYVLVHGIVTVDGKFDKLSLIFPDNLEKKNLLFNSLKLWEFRPAKRDGENTTVEVLLIIPRQS